MVFGNKRMLFGINVLNNSVTRTEQLIAARRLDSELLKYLPLMYVEGCSLGAAEFER
jgi:hypothetical protein